MKAPTAYKPELTRLVMTGVILVAAMRAVPQGVRPKNGMVPNSVTAVRIAEAVLIPIYGRSVLHERPFRAAISKGVWTVQGHIPRGWLGGVAIVKIRKLDGTILFVYHGR